MIRKLVEKCLSVEIISISETVFSLEFPVPNAIGTKELALAWVNTYTEFLEFIAEYSLEPYVKLDYMECQAYISHNKSNSWDFESGNYTDITLAIELILLGFHKHLELLPNPIYKIGSDMYGNSDNSIQKFTFNGLDQLRKNLENLL